MENLPFNISTSENGDYLVIEPKSSEDSDVTIEILLWDKEDLERLTILMNENYANIS